MKTSEPINTLLSAVEDVYCMLSWMTTDEYSKGADRHVRDTLEHAFKDYTGRDLTPRNPSHWHSLAAVERNKDSAILRLAADLTRRDYSE